MIAPETGDCRFCQSRHNMHLRNLNEIQQMYSSDFNLIEIPLSPVEVRGIDALREFSKFIMQ